MINTITTKDIEIIRQEGLKALKDKLGIAGMLKFLQMFSDGKGDFTAEKNELLKNDTIEDFIQFLKDVEK